MLFGYLFNVWSNSVTNGSLNNEKTTANKG